MLACKVAQEILYVYGGRLAFVLSTFFLTFPYQPTFDSLRDKFRALHRGEDIEDDRQISYNMINPTNDESTVRTCCPSAAPGSRTVRYFPGCRERPVVG